MTRAAVLADDATGALEIGALFAKAGVAASVSLDADRKVFGGEALVVDTETRHLPPGEARQRLVKASRLLRTAQLYKKTDSTLRGNIGAELDALLQAYPSKMVLYVPAYPSLGRTVVNGVLLVDGRPVAQTEFAADPENPVRESHIPTLLEQQTSRPIVRWPGGTMSPGTIVVCDGRTEDDLRRMTEYAGDAIVAGAGGFARYWVESLRLPRRHRENMPSIRSLLVVCGSVHPVSLRQASRARRIPGVRVLMTHDPKPAVKALQTGSFDGLAIFGGDTAYALMRALGIHELTPLGEVLPGVPVSGIYFEMEWLPVITKAGGFGGENLIQFVKERMKPTA